MAVAPLNSEFERYPTGATLVVDFVADSWAEAEFGKGITVDFVIPREIVA